MPQKSISSRYVRALKEQKRHRLQVAEAQRYRLYGSVDAFAGDAEGYEGGKSLYYANEAWESRRRGAKVDAIDDLKAQLGCSFCGEKRPEVLQFHHRDPAAKAFTIGSGTVISLESLTVEMAKCDVVCMNCHTLIHAGALLRYKDAPLDGSQRSPVRRRLFGR